MYRSLISVLHEMNYRIVSEGVETKEEELLLREWGVDMIQGYYFSRPINSQEIVKAIPHNRTRVLGERFCAQSKYGKRRNTLCISLFPN